MSNELRIEREKIVARDVNTNGEEFVVNSIYIFLYLNAHNVYSDRYIIL